MESQAASPEATPRSTDVDKEELALETALTTVRWEAHGPLGIRWTRRPDCGLAVATVRALSSAHEIQSQGLRPGLVLVEIEAGAPGQAGHIPRTTVQAESITAITEKIRASARPLTLYFREMTHSEHSAMLNDIASPAMASHRSVPPASPARGDVLVGSQHVLSLIHI